MPGPSSTSPAVVRSAETQLDTCFAGVARGSDGRSRTTVRRANDGVGGVGIRGLGGARPSATSRRTRETRSNRPSRRRQGVAIEPMTCPPNAFASGIDVIHLEPGAAWSAAWRDCYSTAAEGEPPILGANRPEATSGAPAGGHRRGSRWPSPSGPGSPRRCSGRSWCRRRTGCRARAPCSRVEHRGARVVAESGRADLVRDPGDRDVVLQVVVRGSRWSGCMPRWPSIDLSVW